MELKLLNQISLALPAFIFVWTMVYLIICYRSLRQSTHQEWWCRFIVVFLALVVCASISYCLFVIGPNPYADAKSYNKHNEKHHTWTCVLCLVYFIYDLIWSVLFQTEAPVMLMHHIMSLYGISYILYRGSMASELLAIIFTSEITNPMLQIRWFMYDSIIHKTWYAELNTLVFITIFLFSRVILGTYFIYCYMSSPLTEFAVKCACVGIYVVSMVFAFNIAVYTKRHYITMWRQWNQPPQSAQKTNQVKGNNSQISTDQVSMVRPKRSVSMASMQSSIGDVGMKYKSG